VLNTGNLTIKATPIKQGLVVLLSVTTIMLISWLLNPNLQTQWLIALSGLGFYSTMNAVIFFFVRQKRGRYLILSIAGFLINVFLLIGLARLLSPLAPKELRLYAMILLITVLFYFMILMLSTIAKKISDLVGIEP
jgi:hypothetical protein